MRLMVRFSMVAWVLFLMPCVLAPGAGAATLDELERMRDDALAAAHAIRPDLQLPEVTPLVNAAEAALAGVEGPTMSTDAAALLEAVDGPEDGSVRSPCRLRITWDAVTSLVGGGSLAEVETSASSRCNGTIVHICDADEDLVVPAGNGHIDLPFANGADVGVGSQLCYARVRQYANRTSTYRVTATWALILTDGRVWRVAPLSPCLGAKTPVLGCHWNRTFFRVGDHGEKVWN